MPLSPEDSLRLNVMMKQAVKAVRIDESKMCVHALTEKGEARAQLNPNCKDEKYLKLVRELLSTIVLGSPKGYPVFLSRWSRMGQAKDESLDRLLLLGEPEAVVALVHAAGLSATQARHAWWCMPSAETARRMLEKDSVVNDEIGKELADFLIEFLPFEEDQRAMIESVMLVLKPGLISDQERMKLWVKAKSKSSYYVGFMATTPNQLPEQQPAHALYPALAEKLAPLTENPLAQMLLQIHAVQGQSFLQTARAAFKRPNNQDVVVALVNSVANYFNAVAVPAPSQDVTEIICYIDSICADPTQPVAQYLTEISGLAEALEARIKAMLILSCLDEKVVGPIFAVSTAIGSVMRKKLEPVTRPLLQQLDILQQ
ncbi:MAG: sulfur reduction protein DsrS [Gammaproteobacteria bacterium]|nr:sulfur reduction protein DsrS [Gammaproteobacteria bacterium]